ncbi:glycosyltransferase family 2 protein [Streptomyces sp. NPDC048248]|uniref:glycosyltransferase family 2 protein n=1 Tax=Streptomyces sp. NPDC048248 TaxID=3365523 RepID=UPI00371324B6
MAVSDETAVPAAACPPAAAPTVSVIVPVHNTRRYLARSIGSVFAQSLDQARIELIAVDDGSTDGSADWLDEQARRHPNLTVVRAAASGGAGRPRNIGLARATGDYVFFLDSDDRLGPEALDRLTEMAETHGSDIVHGRIVGAEGRSAPVDLRTTSGSVSVFDSPVYWTLAAYKLFRRSFLDKHRLRFTEGRLLGEDLPFGIAALLRAGTVSVLADHDCYHLYGRDDDSNASRQDLDWADQLGYVGTVLADVAEAVPPGPDRDKLMVRHFHGEILACFAAPYLARDAAGRREMAEAARPLVQRYLTDRVRDALPPRLRLRAHCLAAGLLDELTGIVRADTGTDPDTGAPRRIGPAHIDEDGRVYAGYPYFRDPGHGLPDTCYDLTDRLVLTQRLKDFRWSDGVLQLQGTAELPGLRTHSVEVVLRGGGGEYRIPATHCAQGAWHARIDPATAADGAPPADGCWGLKVAVTAHIADGAAAPAVRREAWLCPEGGDTAAMAPRIADGGAAGPVVAALFRSQPHGHLHLDLDRTGVRRPLGGDLRGQATVSPSGRVALTTRLTLPGCPADARLQLIFFDAARTVALRTTVERSAGDRFMVRALLRSGPPGTWRVALRLTAGPLRRELPVRVAVRRGDVRAPLVLTVPQGGCLTAPLSRLSR